MRNLLAATAVAAGLSIGCIPDLPKPPAYPEKPRTEIVLGKHFCSRMVVVAQEQEKGYTGWGVGLLVLAGLSAAASGVSTYAMTDDDYQDEEGRPSAALFGIAITTGAAAIGTTIGGILQLGAAGSSEKVRNESLEASKDARDFEAYKRCLTAWQAD